MTDEGGCFEIEEETIETLIDNREYPNGKTIMLRRDLIWYYRERWGMTYREIADKFGISVSRIGQIIIKTRQKRLRLAEIELQYKLDSEGVGLDEKR